MIVAIYMTSWKRKNYRDVKQIKKKKKQINGWQESRVGKVQICEMQWNFRDVKLFSHHHFV